MSSLYIHIPYCRRACHYCDFHFSTALAGMDKMTDAIAKELILRKNDLAAERLQTVYFGGGTPSLLEAAHWHKIFEAILANHTVDPAAEITMEVNPDDVNEALLSIINTFGFNRISLGIQSFNDERLKLMNRLHTAEEAMEAYHFLRRNGVTNISVDLIYGMEGDRKIWEEDVKTALSLQPEHISTYCLTIEPGTVFGKRSQKGLSPAADSDRAADEYRYLVSQLISGGYEHYEISNFCKPSCHSRHNSNYWSGNWYLGVGPGAHSYTGVARSFNIENNPNYISALQAGILPLTIEKLSEKDKINEQLLTSLRTSQGLSKDWQGFDLQSENRIKMNLFLQNKLVEERSGAYVLTLEGKLLADTVSEKMWIE